VGCRARLLELEPGLWLGVVERAGNSSTLEAETEGW
jgi:hypothetical protein